MPNGNNDYLIIIILKPYVTKIFSEKVEIYGILFEKSLFCAYTKGNTFTIACVLFLLLKLKFCGQHLISHGKLCF